MLLRDDCICFTRYGIMVEMYKYLDPCLLKFNNSSVKATYPYHNNSRFCSGKCSFLPVDRVLSCWYIMPLSVGQYFSISACHCASYQFFSEIAHKTFQKLYTKLEGLKSKTLIRPKFSENFLLQEKVQKFHQNIVLWLLPEI